MTELTGTVTPDADAALANLRREGTPPRVFYMELFLDAEVKDAVTERFGLMDDVSRDDPHYLHKREIAVQRFLGYDWVYTGLAVSLTFKHLHAPDTASLARDGGRAYMEEHAGPITSWADFEQYDWPDPDTADDTALAWFNENLPDDMFLIAASGAHYCEHLCWLMGYESLCYALYDQRDLVQAIFEKVRELSTKIMIRSRQYDRIRAVWGSDDMGFKTATLISPDDTREFVLAGHKHSAQLAHEVGWLYLLHSCGNLGEIIADLLDDVKIDAKHSFEDTIELVTDAKAAYGRRCSLIGGIDVDFLCRADEPSIRRRVRQTLDACLPGGGYCLGSGNSIANYVPLDNYLAMMDEGRRYSM